MEISKRCNILKSCGIWNTNLKSYRKVHNTVDKVTVVC